MREAEQLTEEVISLYNKGEYSKAESLAKRILQLREKSLSADDPLIVAALLNLASLYLVQKNYGNAEPLYTRALTASEAKFGAQSPRLVKIMDSLAVVEFRRGDNKRSAELLERALAIREVTLGGNHPETLTTVYNLSTIYEASNRRGEAQSVLRKSYEALKSAGATEDSKGLTETSLRYACLLLREGKEQEGQAVLDEEAERNEVQKIERDPSTGKVLNGRALSLPQPVYPADAKKLRVSGQVPVTVIVNEQGAVSTACASKGPKALRAASEQAALAARFSPTVVNGKPVKVMGVINYNFTLQ